MSDYKRAGLYLSLVVLLCVSSVPYALAISRSPETQLAAEMAAVVDEECGSPQITEGYEWEVFFFSAQLLRQPDLTTHYQILRKKYMNEDAGFVYRFWEGPASCILVGLFGRFVNAYPEEYLAKYGELIQTVGGYKLYRIRG